MITKKIINSYFPVLLFDMPMHNYDFVQRMTWDKVKTLGPGEFNDRLQCFSKFKNIIGFHYS